ncbi:MAG: class I SAM-dependent methyltransferase [Elusimicrobiales bacterium]|nr:class I SAM-dependent methyltransferase [Elusimicrobiales bacterium]
MKIKNEWHKDFFQNSFYNPASPVAIERAPFEVRFILKQLKLKKNSTILDLCCGPARHSLLLVKKGFIVTGYDFSKEYLKEAKAKAKKLKLDINLICGDMRKLKFKDEFDAALNMFTSFGYFPKFSDDIKVLKGVNKALKPKGLFLIDVINSDFIINNFKKTDWLEIKKGVFLLQEHEFTKDKKGINNRWIKVSKNQCIENTFFTRLYNKQTLSAALKKAGFKPLRFWGGFDGKKLSIKTNRLIVLAQKNK